MVYLFSAVAVHLILPFIYIKNILLIITFLEELRFTYKSLLLSLSLQLLKLLDWDSGNGDTKGTGEK